MYWKVVTDNYHLVITKTFISSDIWNILQNRLKCNKRNGDSLLNFLTKILIFSFK